MKSPKLRLGLAISILVLVAGCSSTGNNSLQYETQASLSSKITEGVTSKTDIYAILGVTICLLRNQLKNG